MISRINRIPSSTASAAKVPKKSQGCLLVAAIAIALLTAVVAWLTQTTFWDDPRFTKRLQGHGIGYPHPREMMKIGSRFAPKWSASGSHIAFVIPGPFDGDFGYEYLGADAYVASSDGASIWRIEEAMSPTASPDGAMLAYVTARYQQLEKGVFNSRFSPEQPLNLEIETSNIHGSDRMRLTHTENSYLDVMPTWSPDGSMIAFARYHEWRGAAFIRFYQGVYTMKRDGTKMRRIVSPQSHEKEDGDSIIAVYDESALGVSWSPSGDELAFVVEEMVRFPYSPPRTNAWALYVVKSDGSQLKRLFEVQTGYADSIKYKDPRIVRSKAIVGSPAWSTNGQAIAFRIVDSADGTVKIMSVGRNSPPREIISFGYELYASDTYTLVQSLSPTSSTLEWSPDGSNVMFSAGNGLSYGSNRLFLVDADGKNLRKIADASDAAFSPDGSRIAVVAPDKYPYCHNDCPEGATLLYTMNPDGSDVQPLVKRDPDSELKAVNAPPPRWWERVWDMVAP